MTRKHYLDLKRTGGKTAFARTADEVLLDIFAFMFSYSLVFSFSYSIKASLFAAAFLCAAFAIIQHAVKKEKSKEFEEAYRAELKERCRLEKFSLLETEEKQAILTKYLKTDHLEKKYGGLFDRTNNTFYYIFPQLQDSEIGAIDIAEIVLKKRSMHAEKCAVLSSAEFSFDAKSLARVQKIEILNIGEVLKNTDMIEVSEKEIDEALNFEMELYREQKNEEKKAILGKGSLFYTGCAIFFGIWPLVFGFSILYPIMSTLCLGLAALSHMTNKAKV